MTKTTRLMLAVLAVCGTSAAMAQSSVTLYGRVNTSVESHKLGTTSASGMVQNSSFIGFKGVEDLGNGLKAGFVLESQFNSDNGSGTTANGGVDFSRNSEVNLAGNFGMLRLGTYDPASYLATADYISMHNHDTGTSSDQLYQVHSASANKIAYRSPELAGFTAEIQYGFGEKANIGKNNHNRGAWDLGLNYANGPLGLGFGYSKEKYRDDTILTGNNNKSNDQYAFRASYAIGDLTLGAYYQRNQKEETVGAKEKANVYRLSAMYKIGASELHANYGRADNKKLNGVKQANTKASQWTLAYNYNLSKRTKVYALYTNIDNAANADYGHGKFVGSSTGARSGDDLRAFGVGVRHLF